MDRRTLLIGAGAAARLPQPGASHAQDRATFRRKLLAIKDAYHPDGLFIVHHGVAANDGAQTGSPDKPDWASRLRKYVMRWTVVLDARRSTQGSERQVHAPVTSRARVARESPRRSNSTSERADSCSYSAAAA
jgi:hypothetical protein